MGWGTVGTSWYDDIHDKPDIETGLIDNAIHIWWKWS